MGVITCTASPVLAAKIYAEGAALPYRGLSVLADVPWGEGGLRHLTIVTDQTPPGPMGRGHFDAIIDGGVIRFKRDCDV